MSVFIKKDNQWVECKEIKEGGSTNDDLMALGYEHNQFYSYTNYNQPHNYGDDCDDILSVCFKVMTEDIICVIASPGRKTLTETEVCYYMQDFDFAHEYSRYSMECDLDSAIAERNFTIQFVAEALELTYSLDDKVLYSNKFGYTFFFERGILVGYEITDGYNREAHDLKDSSPSFYELIEKHARSYHGTNENDIVKEINIQAKAYENIPGGVRNEYFYDFQNSDKSFNMAMLLIAKYQNTEYELCLNYEDCKCICHNELIYDGESVEGLDRILKYKYRSYVLSFDDKGRFLSCQSGKQDNISLGSASMNNWAMEKKTFGLDFKIGSLSYDILEIIKNYLTDLSQGQNPPCYIYSKDSLISCYDDNNHLFYTFNASGLEAWVEEEGVLVGVFGIDQVESSEIEGVITLPLNVYFHAKECDDTFENAIYHLRTIHMEHLRRMGITFDQK